MKTWPGLLAIRIGRRDLGASSRNHRNGRLRSAGTLPAALIAAVMCMSAQVSADVGGWESNQCVSCHQLEELPISLGHSMSEWQASSHARSGVGCEKCHGGNASTADPKTAHQGVLPSSDPASKVSAHNIGATCGGCHERQYDAYKDTIHAKHVAEDGEAATCMTCHGSMATSYPSPRELKSRCSVCHDRPVQAQAALSWLAAAKRHLHRARRAIDETKTAAPEWHSGAVTRMHSLEKDLLAIELEWHQFNTDASIKLSRDLLGLGKLLEEEARLKLQMREHMAE